MSTPDNRSLDEQLGDLHGALLAEGRQHDADLIESAAYAIDALETKLQVRKQTERQALVEAIGKATSGSLSMERVFDVVDAVQAAIGSLGSQSETQESVVGFDPSSAAKSGASEREAPISRAYKLISKDLLWMLAQHSFKAGYWAGHDGADLDIALDRFEASPTGLKPYLASHPPVDECDSIGGALASSGHDLTDDEVAYLRMAVEDPTLLRTQERYLRGATQAVAKLQAAATHGISLGDALWRLWVQAEGCPHCCNSEAVDKAQRALDFFAGGTGPRPGAFNQPCPFCARSGTSTQAHLAWLWSEAKRALEWKAAEDADKLRILQRIVSEAHAISPGRVNCPCGDGPEHGKSWCDDYPCPTCRRGGGAVPTLNDKCLIAIRKCAAVLAGDTLHKQALTSALEAALEVLQEADGDGSSRNDG